ncbi:MAG TPA: hypothetical protein VIH43_09050, partial [Chthoniobacterales bacterium]
MVPHLARICHGPEKMVLMLSNAVATIRREAPSTGKYVGLLALVALIYLGIRAFGDTLSAPGLGAASTPGNRFSQVHVNDFLHVLLALSLVIASARALGA